MLSGGLRPVWTEPHRARNQTDISVVGTICSGGAEGCGLEPAEPDLARPAREFERFGSRPCQMAPVAPMPTSELCEADSGQSWGDTPLAFGLESCLSDFVASTDDRISPTVAFLASDARDGEVRGVSVSQRRSQDVAARQRTPESCKCYPPCYLGFRVQCTARRGFAHRIIAALRPGELDQMWTRHLENPVYPDPVGGSAIRTRPAGSDPDLQRLSVASRGGCFRVSTKSALVCRPRSLRVRKSRQSWANSGLAPTGRSLCSTQNQGRHRLLPSFGHV